MFTITKEFTFEAAHRLVGHSKCGRLHGHSYVVIFELQSSELLDGMVRDYADLSLVKEYIDAELDHRYIVSQEMMNEGDLDLYYKAALESMHPEHLAIIPALPRSTAECLAEFLFRSFAGTYPELTSVTVCETEKTTARFEFNRHLR